MLGAKMGSYQFPQHIAATPRKLIRTGHLLPILCPYIRRQAVCFRLHVGQTSLNIIAEENWVLLSCRSPSEQP